MITVEKIILTILEIMISPLQKNLQLIVKNQKFKKVMKWNLKMSPLKDIKIKKRTKSMIIIYYFLTLTNNLKAIVIAMNKANLDWLLVDPFHNKIICIQ